MPRALVLRVLLIASVLAGAALGMDYRTLPPRAVALPATVPPTTVFGGYHIHSTRSDGSGTVDAIARAAHDAGLAFIILTDHGDGTAAPLAPAYRFGVLCIDAVEISTNGGHVVALGLDAASPYPMAGDPLDVIEDIHRRGGFAIVAHPDSAKPELEWRAWNTPYDGIEWLNADSERRDETTLQLINVGLHLALRPPETIASEFRRPTTTIRRWDATLRRRPVAAFAGLDAHANLFGWPRYRDMFETVTEGVVLEAPLSGRADDDAHAVVTALRRGHAFSLVRAFAGPAALEFQAVTSTGTVGMGDWTSATDGVVTWQVRVPQAPDAHVILVSDGRQLAGGRGSLTYRTPVEPGAYRVEVTYPGFAMPWIVSNPIYVGGTFTEPITDPATPPAVDALNLEDSAAWRVEHDAASSGQVEHADGGLRFSYALGPGQPNSQYAAAVVPVSVGGTDGFDRVQFQARSDRPMRLSVQVKLPGGGGQRWRRSAFVDGQPRQIVLPLSSFSAADRPTSQQPIASAIVELLIVVDTVNTAPGTRGTLWFTGAALGRASGG